MGSEQYHPSKQRDTFDWGNDLVMHSSVQAQYYRDPAKIDVYLEVNEFLASINNEVPDLRNVTYTQNLASLSKLVLVIFTEDKTVVPKESSWFGAEEVDSNVFLSQSDDQATLKQRLSSNAGRAIIPMRLQPLYLEDWIGLRKLDKRGAIIFETCKGEHMQMGDCWENLVRMFVGGQA